MAIGMQRDLNPSCYYAWIVFDSFFSFLLLLSYAKLHKIICLKYSRETHTERIINSEGIKGIVHFWYHKNIDGTLMFVHR